MFLCSFIQELCFKEENIKTDCSFNFEHRCNNKNKGQSKGMEIFLCVVEDLRKSEILCGVCHTKSVICV